MQKTLSSAFFHFENAWQARIQQSDSKAWFAIVFTAVFLLVISPAFNIPFSAGIITLNLAKIGIGLSCGLLISLTYRQLGHFLTYRSWLFLIGALWLGYLLFINTPLSLYPIITLKMSFRISGSLAVALCLAFALTAREENTKESVFWALTLALFVIALVLYFDQKDAVFIEEFRQQYLAAHSINNYIAHGFYQNQNELAWAAVMHLAGILWVGKNTKLYAVFKLISTLLCFWIIHSSTSRNSMLGLMFVLSIYLIFRIKNALHFNKISNLKVLAVVFILLCGITSLLVLNPGGFFPVRFADTFHQFVSAFFSYQMLSNPLNTLGNLLTGIAPVRSQLWVIAWEKFLIQPMTGIGLGSFVALQTFGAPHTTHNFVYSILVDQGILGVLFSIGFCFFLLYNKVSLKGFLFFLVLPMSMLFDDLSPSYTFSSYLALWLALMLYFQDFSKKKTFH